MDAIGTRLGWPMDSGAPRFSVNGIVADFGAGELRDADGQLVRLRPQSLAVLRHLAANPGRLVGKDELMAAVWRGIAVTDDSLVQCIGEIRRAIGDEAHAIVRTVPRAGYRLELPGPVPDARAWRPGRWLLAGGLAAALVLGVAAAWMRPPQPARLPLVAVVPFATIGEDDASARVLARGLTDDVVNDLAGADEFEVMAADAAAGLEREAPERIAAALGADFVVVGTIARQGDRIRISAGLRDARGRVVWSDRWDRPAGDFFAVQAEIAEAMTNQIGGGAGRVEDAGRQAARRKPPGSLDAYQLYLLGSEARESLSKADIEASLVLLHRAVAADPGLARAWVEIFHQLSALVNLGIEPEKNRGLGLDAARQAVTLDPGDAEAHSVYAQALGQYDDLVRAKVEFELALRMAPSNMEILAQYIPWAVTFGDPERGADLVDRAERLNPNHLRWANRPFAYAEVMAGRYEKALVYYDRLGFDQHNLWSWPTHAGVLAALGRHDEAEKVREMALKAIPDLTIELMLNQHGTVEAERARLVELMRQAGFPACADPATLAAGARRLPECAAATRTAEGR